MSQLIFNVLFSTSVYLLVSISFISTYYPAKFFNLAHGAIISLGAYFAYMFSKQLSLPIFVSIILSIILATIFGLLIYKTIFKPLRNNKTNNYILLLTSLGVYIIIVNCISLIWGSDAKTLRFFSIQVGHKLLGAYITNSQLIIMVGSIILFVGSLFISKYSKIGIRIRAISENEDLANILGLSSNKIILWAFVIGSILASIAGILLGIESTFSPLTGFRLLLYGIVAMIIGGVGSIRGLIVGSLLLATAQNLGAYYIDSKWMDAIAYMILILFLIWKPLGFSGRRLKKVEL